MWRAGKNNVDKRPVFRAHLTYFCRDERRLCIVYKNLCRTGAKCRSSWFNGVNYIKRPTHARAGKTICLGVGVVAVCVQEKPPSFVCVRR